MREKTEKTEFDERKFKELILYIATKCQDDIFWGATKLNKQLFFSDFLAYRDLDRPITGADYMALAFGPAPRRLVPIRQEMIEEQDCSLEEMGAQERIVARREPDLSVFSENELRLVDQVIAALRDTTADEASDLAHRFPGWKAAIREGEATGRHVSIPYSTVFVRTQSADEKVIDEGLRLADMHRWPI